MPFARPSGRFLHSANMTFAHYDIAAGADIVEGEVAVTIEGEEQVLGAGCIAVVPPDTPHSVRPLGACRAVTAD